VIASDGVMLVLRTFHIIAGVLWVGSAFFFVAFLGPASGMVGPEVSGPFFQVLVAKMHVPRVITRLGMVTVTFGWLLWLKDLRDYSDWNLNDWVFHHHFGLVLTIGAILASLAFFEGYLGVGKNVEKLTEMGGQIAASGAPPTPEQQSRMQKIQADIKKHGQQDLVLLLLAVFAMATARYW
jgi:ribose/xylose/arabinose/galactoside ABC-type transport system permease subunit